MRRSLGVALLLLSTNGYAATFTGMAIRVADGDSVTVEDSATKAHIRVRLAGIDAPEKGQAFNDASRKSLGFLLVGYSVTVEWNKRDRYKRIVGRVLLDGKDAALHQLYSGMAWHHAQKEWEQSAAEQSAYAEAEEVARTKRVGLWQDPSPVAPWKHVPKPAPRKEQRR